MAERAEGASRLPLLQVKTRREGRLRLTCCVVVNLAILLTGVACYVWEVRVGRVTSEGFWLRV